MAGASETSHAPASDEVPRAEPRYWVQSPPPMIAGAPPPPPTGTGDGAGDGPGDPPEPLPDPAVEPPPAPPPPHAASRAQTIAKARIPTPQQECRDAQASVQRLAPTPISSMFQRLASTREGHPPVRSTIVLPSFITKETCSARPTSWAR